MLGRGSGDMPSAKRVREAEDSKKPQEAGVWLVRKEVSQARASDPPRSGSEDANEAPTYCAQGLCQKLSEHSPT